MTIEFPCPQCSQVVRTPDAAAGKKGKCPSCQAVMQIPQPQATPKTAAKPTAQPAANKTAQPLAKPTAPANDVGPIEFYCTFCGQVVRTPRTAAGKKGKCPHCQEVVQIPLTSPAKPTAKAPAPAPPKPAAKPGTTAPQAAHPNPLPVNTRGAGAKTAAKTVAAIPAAPVAPTSPPVLAPLAPLTPLAPQAPLSSGGDLFGGGGDAFGAMQNGAAPGLAELPAQSTPPTEDIVSAELMPATTPLAPLIPLAPLAPLGGSTPAGGDLFGGAPPFASSNAIAASQSLAPLQPLGGSAQSGDLFGGSSFGGSSSGYSSSTYDEPKGYGQPAGGVAAVATAIHIPAIIQLVVVIPFAGIYLLYLMSCLLYGFLGAIGTTAMSRGFQTLAFSGMVSGLMWAAITGAFLAMQGVIIFGSIRQLQRKSFKMAQAAAWLALIPCASPMGMPAAIWSLMGLRRLDVQQTFRS